ncbi:MAG: 4-coumarate--CoA ligase family protein, partial [Gordonia sp. (in: high G+C Gram-positive bacteria)]
SVGVTPPLSSAGWTVPNAVSKVINPGTGAEIGIPESGRSEAGELWFSGPNVMAGYLGNDKATSETIDGDGFLHTGDMACVDSTGCVYIVDRLKELIKYKGYQVPPAELEALLLTHPGIADAAVIGVTDADGEEIPKAFVVKQSGATVDEEQVMAFVADNVAPYKKVRRVEFIDAIPKSASGKILRKDLRG